MRLTLKAFFIVLLTLISLSLGIMTVNPFVLAISEFLAIFLTLSRFFAGTLDTRIRVYFDTKEISVYESQDFDLRISIKNEGHELRSLTVIPRLPNDVNAVSGKNFVLLDLHSGKTTYCDFVLNSENFGLYRVGPIELIASDVFGIFQESIVIEDYAEVRVLPHIQYTKTAKLEPKVTKNWPGEIVTRRTGPGLEFHHVRNYEYGDQLRKINWKASARLNRLMTNQYANELGGDVVIAVDLRNQVSIDFSGEKLEKYTKKAAALVSYRLIKERNRVGMIIVGSSLIKVPSGFGKRQLDRILYALMQTKAGGLWEIENLPKFLSFFFPKIIYVIVITPMSDEKSYNAVLQTAVKGYRTLLISPTPIPAKSIATSKYEEVAINLLSVERKLRLESLRRYLEVIEWDKSGNLFGMDRTLGLRR